MSLIVKAFKGGLWFGLFRAISQTFAWFSTIIIARILVPGDYGLMEMATILTGYVALFSELGLGAAIIQREKINDNELSSLFWFMIIWGLLLGLSCIILAYPTVAIFNEERLLRVTQSVSILFIIESFLIIPLNILKRDIKFKALGFIEAISIIISCIMMIIIAKFGGGVWTLIGGHIVRELLKTLIIFIIIPWKPRLHFKSNEIKPYIKFGLNIAGANSLYYIYSKSDRFFGGRAMGAGNLGYYSLALQLSAIPNDKLISLINTVSFPVFSRYQNNYHEFNTFYLRLINLIAYITFPLYIGGFFIADQLIPFILGPKWEPLIFPFKLLCIAQLILSITTPNGMANTAQRRPHWHLYMSLVNAFVLPISFYFVSSYGLNALAIPWITINPLVRFGYTYITIKKIGIKVSEYIKNLKHPIIATISMLFVLLITKHFYFNSFLAFYLKSYVILTILIGAISYILYIWAFQRSFLVSIFDLMRG